MRIKLTNATVKEANNAYLPGEIMNIDDNYAERYIKNGWAISLEPKKEKEIKSNG